MIANPTQKIPRLSQTTETLTSAERWQAITKRDTTVNSFVYGVITTKIYCRPSCGARLARRTNVKFYNTPSQAENAGFRPCKRCRPQLDGTAVQSNPQTAMVKKACKEIREKTAAGQKPRLNELAAQAGLTPSHFHRVFKKLLGVTPGQYAISVTRNGSCASGSLSPETLSEFETPPQQPSPLRVRGLGTKRDWDFDVDLVRGSALPEGAAPLDSPVIMDYSWNEFDLLLAAEEQGRLEPWEACSIDPRIL
ncbi:uncharacterized protein N7483_001066 [Penicillium malachiteum]|uniref:uncharacterized protein n=1 Tax=Penicillium malachiteum TaxID=1324776 RepID=UPI002547883C|nr:uncharacterized protein N7483_001066 [Penicillium malachiteum]KAJ5735941.1 hypothetical protein N7483_001066 [Penicillium malachiteum]